MSPSVSATGCVFQSPLSSLSQHLGAQPPSRSQTPRLLAPREAPSQRGQHPELEVACFRPRASPRTSPASSRSERRAASPSYTTLSPTETALPSPCTVRGCFRRSRKTGRCQDSAADVGQQAHHCRSQARYLVPLRPRDNLARLSPLASVADCSCSRRRRPVRGPRVPHRAARGEALVAGERCHVGTPLPTVSARRGARARKQERLLHCDISGGCVPLPSVSRRVIPVTTTAHPESFHSRDPSRAHVS